MAALEKPSSPLAADVLADLLARARRLGADAADAVYSESAALSVAYRLKPPADVERAETRDVTLRAFVSGRQALAATTDLRPATLQSLAERVVAMAKAAPVDPYADLATTEQLATDLPDLALSDAEDPAPDILIARARTADEAARAVQGITNSENAEAGFSRTQFWLATSHGFSRGYTKTQHSLSASVLAGTGTDMQRDYDYTVATHARDLRDPAAIGQSAGERTVRRLNAQKLSTRQVPVVFDPRVASSLVGHFLSAIHGASIARGTSFLKDAMGAQIFAEDIVIHEDPHRPSGLRSRPFDGEGLPTHSRNLAEGGRLAGWILDLRCARQLGLAPTGQAGRGGGLPTPSATNVALLPGKVTPTALMADIKDGVYVTELLGMGVNLVTGDYSRGAAGFRIENGVLTTPVHEITLAGHLTAMFKNLRCANDWTYRTGLDAPTVRVDGLTVAGT